MYKRWEVPRSKRQLQRVLRWVKKAKTWQLLIVLILFVFLSATFLRLNNIGMIERRNAVYVADKEGDTQKIKKQLIELQHYVSTHMNTSLDRGIYLEHSYNRDREVAITTAANAHNTQSEIYQKASLECRAKFQGGVDSFRNDYVRCVEAAVSSLPAEQQLETYLPRAASYHYNFASPYISFDIAGIATIITICLGVFIFVRLLLLYLLRWLVRRRSRVI